jgi:hypothetical protein
MKAVCSILLVVNIIALAAAYFPSETWAYRVCGSAFGLCDYPLVLALGVAGWVGMVVMLKEIN